jgi:hypothetical protein
MTAQQQKDLANKTFELLQGILAKLNPGLEVTSVPKDPAFIPKDRCKDVMRIRVLPKAKIPSGFWSTHGCFYEIGVGPYFPLCLGGVQFFQYSQQQQCGSRYAAEVGQILKQLQSLAPRGFLLGPTSDGKFHFQRRYMASEFKGRKQVMLFPCAQAAADLAWLIAESAPRFATLQSQ